MSSNVPAAYLAATAAAVLLSVAAEQQCRQEQKHILNTDFVVRHCDKRNLDLHLHSSVQLPKRRESLEQASVYASKANPQSFKRKRIQQSQANVPPKTLTSCEEDTSSVKAVWLHDSKCVNETRIKPFIKEETNNKEDFSENMVIKEEMIIKEELLEDSSDLAITDNHISDMSSILVPCPLTSQDDYSGKDFAENMVIKEEMIIKEVFAS